ncbi:MAG: hypothetical protein IAI48_01260 [Candidatus Eremiobacteraeota bacterium]|nr:hypothetical protein [Candidatus Eremiobacteraeota bacterium]
MPVDRNQIRALADEVGRFYVRERTMRRAQEAIRTLLASDVELDDAAVRGYLRAVTTYFTGFEREARGHLADLERRLARASQLQFNLTAERGVAARRVEATQGVLSHLAEVAPRYGA